jgi:hypothetical protein
MFKSGIYSSNFRLGTNNFSGNTRGTLFYTLYGYHQPRWETIDAWGFRSRGALTWSYLEPMSDQSKSLGCNRVTDYNATCCGTDEYNNPLSCTYQSIFPINQSRRIGQVSWHGYSNIVGNDTFIHDIAASGEIAPAGQIACGDYCASNSPAYPGQWTSSGDGAYAVIAYNPPTLFTWGYNAQGQLGLGNTTNTLHPYTPVDFNPSPHTMEMSAYMNINDGTFDVVDDFSGNVTVTCSLLNDSFANYTNLFSSPRIALKTFPSAVVRNNDQGGCIDSFRATASLGNVKITGSGLFVLYNLGPIGSSSFEFINITMSFGYGVNQYDELQCNDLNDIYVTGLISGSFGPPISDNQWIKVWAGYNFFVGLKQSGRLYSWGKNDLGQLGDNSTTNRSTPVQVTGNNTTWIDVSPGRDHCVALRSDNTLWAWGYNAYGQLGDSTTTNRSSPVQIAGSWSRIFSGNFRTFAIKTDGTLWGWGDNSGYYLGDGTATNRSSPVMVGSDLWQNIYSANIATYGIKNDGTLYGWGNGPYGLSAGYKTSPTLISSATDHRALQTGYNGNASNGIGGAFLPSGSTAVAESGLPFIDATGGVLAYTGTTSTRSNVYVGGGARKIVAIPGNTWLIKQSIFMNSSSNAYYFNNPPSESFTDGTYTAYGLSFRDVADGSGYVGADGVYRNSYYFHSPHSVLINSPGTHSIVVPPNMNYMHVLCVGGGGSGGTGISGSDGGNNVDGGGGGGGALAYRNNISVTSGQEVKVVVGHGGQKAGWGEWDRGGYEGGPSYVVYNSTSYAYAGGGKGPISGSSAGAGGVPDVSTYTGGGVGGSGSAGSTNLTGGGGGAGGYSGAGGVGTNGTGTGGGGGGGYSGGGGGVGVYGTGTNGTSRSPNYGANGGSGGNLARGIYSGGGLYGGGGSGGFWNSAGGWQNSGPGGGGAVRLIFYNGATTGSRAFPTDSNCTYS